MIAINKFDSDFDYSVIKQRFLPKLESVVQTHCRTIYYIIAFDSHFSENINFVFLICVPDDETASFLRNDQKFNATISEIIQKTKTIYDFSINISVEIESQETVDRTADGNWINYLKKESGG